MAGPLRGKNPRETGGLNKRFDFRYANLFC